MTTEGRLTDLGMTNFRNWRIPVLLYAGNPDWTLLPRHSMTPLNPKCRSSSAGGSGQQALIYLQVRIGYLREPEVLLNARKPCKR